MKKICCVLAAMATIAFVAAPSIASAQDKPMMKEGMQDGMKKPHRMSHKKMMKHHKMTRHHKMMKKEM